MDEELLLARIIAGIEGGGGDDESYYHELVTDLKSLLDTDDDEILKRFYGSLSSMASSFLRCFSAAMDSPVESGRLAILASDAYLSLLLSTNCPVFTFFSPVAFLYLLGSIRRYLKPRHREDSGTAASQGNKKKRGRGSRNNARNLGHEDGDETEEGGFDAKLLLRVLEHLGSVLGFVHLDRFPNSLKSLVQTVSEIPLLALEHSGVLNYDRLMQMCGRILGGVLCSDHGDLSLTAAEISKSLTPLLLMGKHQARSFALCFVSRKIMGLAKDNSELKKVVSNLPKFLVHKAPEKAEPRGFAVEAILEIVKAMEVEDQSDFVDFVMKMGQGKSNFRILAVDLIPLLISSLGNPLASISSKNGVIDSWGLGCLNALVQRCSDSSALIRARALSNLAQVVGFLSGDERSRSILKQALGFNGETSEGKGVVTDLLNKRCVDEKAAARRAALLLVTKLTSLLGGCFDVSILKTMGTSCSDPLISIRKAAISALSEAFRICTDKIVTTEWLHSVPRMIMDNETSIQEECENVFHELVLERISRAGNALFRDSASLPNNWNSNLKDLDRDIEALFPEGVLVLLRQLCNSEVSPWVNKICNSSGKKKQLKPRVALALQSIIKESESLWLNRSMPINRCTAPAGAWFFLSEVSVYLPKSVEWEFLHHHWQLLDNNDLKEGTDGQGDEEGVECNSSTWAGDRVCLLQTISNVSLQLPPEPAADLADNLLKKIEKFDLHSADVDAHVKALKTFCLKKACTLEESDVLVKKEDDERARSKRMQVYVTLLKHLLATFAKLCAEVLVAASDGMLNIEDITGQSVLQDAFQILACKEICLSVSRGSSSETVEMEEEGGDSNAAAAKGRAITQAVRKGLIQNTIPIFIELKRLLESKNSPLTGSLLDCLRVLLKDYKNEIEEILVADKQLQKELVYDMQKHEAAKARSMANQGVAWRTSQRSGEPEQPTAAASEENVRDSGLKTRVVSAAADAVAAKAASLREVNDGAAKPPLSATSVPKLRSSRGGSQSGRPSADVLESLRRRPTFMCDDNN